MHHIRTLSLLERKGIDKSVSQCNLREGTPFFSINLALTQVALYNCSIVLAGCIRSVVIYNYEPY